MIRKGREHGRRHERLVVGAALATLTALAWAYIYSGAGTGMPARTMTALALFPHLRPDPMAGMSMPPPFGFVAAIAMWWVMMIAMMTPSAAPLVLLYGRVLRHHQHDAATAHALAPSIWLVAGYLAAWLAFSIGAASLQMLLLSTGFTSTSMLWSQNATFSAVVLAVAGVYQLSPLKSACLAQCRSPVAFLTQHWRPGRAGAFVIGVRHGAFCVGCCWMLMTLLFIGGLMNLAWIAALTLLVLVEKLTPAGPIVSKVAGFVLLAWAVATVVV